VIIPVPYIFRFIPPRVIQFQGRAEILPVSDPSANEVYKWRMPKDVDACLIRIRPRRKIWTHGIGMSAIERGRPARISNPILEAKLLRVSASIVSGPFDESQVSNNPHAS